MPIVKYVANNIQIKQGILRYAEIIFFLINIDNSIITNISKRVIQSISKNLNFHKKNIIDQKALTKSVK